MRRLAILPAALLLLGDAQPILSDSARAGLWTAQGSDQVQTSSRETGGPKGREIELDYNFGEVNGYAFIRRKAQVALPTNFEVRFRMRGQGGRNDIQFKLTDGDNVWWKVWRNRRPSADWQDVVIPAGDFAFAWGPTSDHRLTRADGIELVVARDRDGGSGKIAISNLRIVAVPGAPRPSIAQDDRQNDALAALAKASSRGAYPRSFLGEQSYWTLAGSDGQGIVALVDEDGAIEFEKGGYSIAPTVIDAGTTFNWANVAATQGLMDGRLPVPTVRWSTPRFTLETTLLADYAGRAAYAAYNLTNTGRSTRMFELRLQLRPWQVNPPSQFLSQKGGASPISSIVHSPSALTIIQPADEGDPPANRRLLIERGAQLHHADQPRRAGTEMLGMDIVYPVTLPPGRTRRIVLTMPTKRPSPPFDAALAETLAYWRRVSAVTISVPPAKQPFADTVATALSHVLMSRDGPMLRPGTRSYARSWIRDGAMMSEALLRMGRPDVARAFADWYGKHQFANGKVPCCVDFRGADPVPENDSQGEYILLVSDLYRFTHDLPALQRDWPHVLAAVRYMDKLRLSERPVDNGSPAVLSRGLMPASISHEGYSAKPQYSLWDDFWALRGYDDATEMASILGSPDVAAIARSRDEFAADLHSAILAARDHWRISFIPGATSLGDFDPTSTTIALDPGNDQQLLDRSMLNATFERYWNEFHSRASAERSWEDYTPYEVRTIGTFVRLGWRGRIDDLLQFFMAGQRPSGWKQWAEVVGRDPRKTRFIGDMPHAWVASDFIRSALDMFAWDRRSDQALVLGGGLSPGWLTGQGSSIHGLSTPYGSLDFSMHGEPRSLMAKIRGTAAPPGGFVIPWPFDSDPPPVRVNGRLVDWPKTGLRIRPTGQPILVEVASLPAAILTQPPSNKDT